MPPRSPAKIAAATTAASSPAATASDRGPPSTGDTDGTGSVLYDRQHTSEREGARPVTRCKLQGHCGEGGNSKRGCPEHMTAPSPTHTHAHTHSNRKEYQFAHTIFAHAPTPGSIASREGEEAQKVASRRVVNSVPRFGMAPLACARPRAMRPHGGRAPYYYYCCLLAAAFVVLGGATTTITHYTDIYANTGAPGGYAQGAPAGLQCVLYCVRVFIVCVCVCCVFGCLACVRVRCVLGVPR